MASAVRSFFMSDVSRVCNQLFPQVSDQSRKFLIPPK